MTNATINFDTLKPIEILPHRAPMLLIDKVLFTDFDTKIITETKIEAGAIFFQGHFPTYPIMPGIFIVEIMYQACGILNRISKPVIDENPRIGKAVKIKSAVFFKEVLPGSTLVINAEKIQTILNFGEYKATATVDGKKVCQADLTVTI